MNKYTWLFLDLDNTILDFNASSEDAFFKMFSRRGITMTDADYQAYRVINHQVWSQMEQGLIDHKELKTQRWTTFFESKNINWVGCEANDAYFEIIKTNPVFMNGADIVLPSLAKQYKLCMITNGISEVQRPRIKLSDIGQYFDTIVVSDEIGMAKPDPAFFDYCMAETGQPPKNEVLVIGDTLQSDIVGGLDYGLDTCWMDNNGEDSGFINSTYTITSIAQLEKVLLSM